MTAAIDLGSHPQVIPRRGSEAQMSFYGPLTFFSTLQPSNLTIQSAVLISGFADWPELRYITTETS
jgi:hypothetical protein